MILDMRKDKMLFVFKRCEHDDNKISASKNLSFLSIILFVINTRFFKFIAKDNSNEDNFNVNFLKDITKRLTSTLKTFKKKMIQKFNLLDIIEINVSIYYHLIRNKENKLFSLIINKIYDILIESFEVLLSIKRDNRILINDSYLYNFDTLGETRDLGMKHVDSIDFMLKSSFCQLSIDCSLTVHSPKTLHSYIFTININLIDSSQILY